MLQRFIPYLGIVAALALGFVLLSAAGSQPVTRSARTATSTLSVVPSLTVPTITLPSLSLGTAANSASPAPITKAKPLIAPKAASTTKVVSAPVTVPTPPAQPVGEAELNATASALRAALVNILCFAPPASGIHSASGSGVFIDSKGTILTNAHIAQYFLFADRGVTCSIRTGSPAVARYSGALVYISPKWLRANATAFTEAAPSGTGEFDFALVAVVKSVTTDHLPAAFPALPLAKVAPSTGTPVVIGSYGAQFLDISQIQSGLFPTLVFGSVQDIYTFTTNTVDVLSLGGSAAAQEGSSGGGVATGAGELAGTITTSTVEGATASRRLGAITASYIRSEYANEMGSSIELLLDEQPATAAADFAIKIPALEAILTAHLP